MQRVILFVILASFAVGGHVLAQAGARIEATVPGEEEVRTKINVAIDETEEFKPKEIDHSVMDAVISEFTLIILEILVVIALTIAFMEIYSRLKHRNTHA